MSFYGKWVQQAEVDRAIMRSNDILSPRSLAKSHGVKAAMKSTVDRRLWAAR